MAIIRSPSPLRKIKEDANLSCVANKMVALVKSSEERARPHAVWKREQVERQCDQKINTAMCSLSLGHFKQKQIDFKKENINAKGSKFKRQNAAQQAGAMQHVMPVVKGLIPCSKLIKRQNLDDLKVDLLFRGVKEDVIPKSITDRKNELRKLELMWLRVVGVEEAAAKKQADSHFQMQSFALFELED